MQCFDTYQRTVFLFDYDGVEPQVNLRFIHNNVEWLITQVVPDAPTLTNTDEHLSHAQKWDNENLTTRLYISYVQDV